jgi:hypothetical protein
MESTLTSRLSNEQAGSRDLSDLSGSVFYEILKNYGARKPISKRIGETTGA